MRIIRKILGRNTTITPRQKNVLFLWNFQCAAALNCVNTALTYLFSVGLHFSLVAALISLRLRLVLFLLRIRQRFPLTTQFRSNLADFPARMYLHHACSLIMGKEEERRRRSFRRIRVLHLLHFANPSLLRGLRFFRRLSSFRHFLF